MLKSLLLCTRRNTQTKKRESQKTIKDANLTTMTTPTPTAPTPPAPAASFTQSESTQTEPGDSDSSTPSPGEEPAELLATSLRAHAQRLRIAKVRTEFEHTVLTILTLNVIYTYYLDHTLFVLAIRVSQVIRLLYLPYATPAAQHGTAVLLLISSLPVLIIHKMLFSGPAPNLGDMLFINFIGPEPKSLPKLFAVDILVMALQAVLLQCKWESSSFRPLSVLPLPASEPLEETT